MAVLPEAQIQCDITRSRVVSSGVTFCFGLSFLSWSFRVVSHCYLVFPLAVSLEVIFIIYQTDLQSKYATSVHCCKRAKNISLNIVRYNGKEKEAKDSLTALHFCLHHLGILHKHSMPHEKIMSRGIVVD